jgi:hypothetical protein
VNEHVTVEGSETDVDAEEIIGIWPKPTKVMAGRGTNKRSHARNKVNKNRMSGVE